MFAVIIDLMGSNSVTGVQGRVYLMQNWLPKEGEANILVNHYTHLQIERHLVTVAIKDLKKQSTLFTSRINNQQVGVCRLFYYHTVGNQDIGYSSSSLQFKEMWAYTDRLRAIKDWNREKVLEVVQGLKNLMTLYGPFRVNEGNIRQDIEGKVRVWISHNAVSNYVDFKYVVQEQVVGDLAALLFRRNVQVGNLLLGCHSLKEVEYRLNVKKKEIKGDCSYRSEGVKKLDFNKAAIDKHVEMLNKQYGEGENASRTDGNLPMGKIGCSSIDRKVNYGGSNKEQKKSSKSNNFSSYKQLYYPRTGQVLGDVSKKGEQERFKQQHETSFFKSKGRSEDSPVKKVVGSPLKFNNIPVKEREAAVANANFMEYKQSVNPITFSKRFSTVVGSPISGKKEVSGKNRNANGSHSGSGNKFTIFKTSNQLSSLGEGDFREEKKRVGGCDITIINNNVSNYIHNVTHNHIVKMERKDKETFQFRPSFKNGEERSAKGQMAQTAKEDTFKGREHNVPIFIKQRRKLSNLLPPKESLAACQQQQSQKGPKSMKQRMSQFEKVLNGGKLQSKKSQKNIDVIRNTQETVSPYNSGINHKQSQFTKMVLPFSIKSSQSKEEDNNISFESRVPLRTKTTEFHDKWTEGRNKAELANVKKSAALSEKKKSEGDSRPTKYASREPSILQEPSEQFRTTSPSCRKDQRASPRRQEISDFKKSLKQEFSSVLGEQVVGVVAVEGGVRTREQEQEELQQRMIRDKIKYKKIVFAELKKQALKVLSDT